MTDKIGSRGGLEILPRVGALQGKSAGGGGHKKKPFRPILIDIH